MKKMSNDQTTLEYRKDYALRRLSYVNYMKVTSKECPTT